MGTHCNYGLGASPSSREVPQAGCREPCTYGPWRCRLNAGALGGGPHKAREPTVTGCTGLEPTPGCDTLHVDFPSLGLSGPFSR